ncbi:MAG: phage holin family protein [Gemmatimonadota bacterium]|nr:phage holin family protein [Gemmatimonadota bacterium]
MADGHLTRPNGPGMMGGRRMDMRFDERPLVQGQERSIGELIGALSSDLSLLMRQEVALAKAEMGQKAAAAGKQAGKIAVGGVLAHTGALALTAAVIAGLAALGVAVWLAALIVGVIYLAVGFAMLKNGMTELKKAPPMPARTVQTLRDDVNWAKEQLR